MPEAFTRRLQLQKSPIELEWRENMPGVEVQDSLQHLDAAYWPQ